jgi:hypothetical protein
MEDSAFRHLFLNHFERLRPYGIAAESSDTVVIDGRMKEAALKRRLRGVSKRQLRLSLPGPTPLARNRAALFLALLESGLDIFSALKIMRIPL